MTSILEVDRSLNSYTLAVHRPLAYFRSANVKTFCKYAKSIIKDVNCFVKKWEMVATTTNQRLKAPALLGCLKMISLFQCSCSLDLTLCSFLVKFFLCFLLQSSDVRHSHPVPLVSPTKQLLHGILNDYSHFLIS